VAGIDCLTTNAGRRKNPKRLLALPPVIREPEPMVTPRGVVMVIMFVTGTLAIVMILQRPPSRRNRRA
jgi:hypothetical protein